MIRFDDLSSSCSTEENEGEVFCPLFFFFI